jgi:hypothetical protein
MGAAGKKAGAWLLRRRRSSDCSSARCLQSVHFKKTRRCVLHILLNRFVVSQKNCPYPAAASGCIGKTESPTELRCFPVSEVKLVLDRKTCYLKNLDALGQ